MGNIPLCTCEIYPLHLPSNQPPISLRPWSQATGGKMLGLAASKDRWMVAGKAGEQFWYVIIVRQHTGEQGIQDPRPRAEECDARGALPWPRHQPWEQQSFSAPEHAAATLAAGKSCF